MLSRLLPVVASPNLCKPLELAGDASGLGLDTVLASPGWTPLGYYSRKMSAQLWGH